MGLFPEQKGGDSLPFKTVAGAITLLVFFGCVFLQLQGYGVFERLGKWGSTIGSAIISVLDELWKQPS